MGLDLARGGHAGNYDSHLIELLAEHEAIVISRAVTLTRPAWSLAAARS